jgi:glycosyltransferase involved in cell wall biosynthesis
MKISFISPFYPYRGGIAQFSDRLENALSASNELDKVNYSRLYPEFLFPGKSQFVDDYVLEKSDLKYGVDSINLFKFLSTVKRIKSQNSDVLITSYWMSFFSPVLSLICFFLGKRTKKVALIHNLIPHEKRFFDSFLTKLYVSQQDAFVVLSEKVKQDVLRMKSNAKVKLLYHPLYDQFGDKIDRKIALDYYNIPSSKKYVLFFGLIRDYKGLDVLIESISNLSDEYHLIIAGECYGSFELYNDLINKNNLSNRITYIDRFIPDNEVNRIFSIADVCVLPYKSATQSGVTAVALHFDVPVISTKVGGLNEYVLHEKTGLLVEPNNSDKLAESIQLYFDDDLESKFKAEMTDLKQKLSWENFSYELNLFLKSFDFESE